MEEVGLHKLEHYVKVRRNTISKYIRERLIFDLCLGEERRRGTSNRRQFWWEQPMDLEPESGVAVVSDDDEASVSSNDNS